MLKNIIQSLLTKGMIALINFFILLISSRYLGVSTRGEISIFLLNIFFIQVISEVYTGYSIIHFVPKYNLKKLFVTGLVFTFIFCSVTNVVITIIGKQLTGYGWLAYIISLLVILNTFNCVVILAKEKVKTYNLLSFIQPFVLLLGIVFFISVLKIYTVEAYLFPLLISFLIAIILSGTSIIKLLLKEIPLKEFNLRAIIKAGVTYQAGILMFIFCNRFSYYLMDDSAKVGLYSSASALTESILIISMAISPVLISRIANLDSNSQSVEIALSLSKLSLLFGVFIVFILALIPDSLFTTILGNGFKGIKQLMLIYSPAVLLVSVFITLSNYFLALGKQNIVLKNYSLGFISTLILAPLFIKKVGTEGAAYSATIAYLLMAIGICYSFININKISFKRFFSLREDYKNIIKLMRF